MGYNRLITHGIWILHHQCVSFSSTLHRIGKKPTKAGNTYIVFCPPHGKDDTGNYILPVYLLRKDLHYHSLKYLPLHLLLGGLPGPRPSKLPFTSFSSVTSSISSSLKRPFTPYAEKSTPLKSHNMPLPCIKPVTPPFPMRSITSS